MQRFKIINLGYFLLLYIPAFAIGILILKNSVNVPLRDEWAVARILVHEAFKGYLSFADLIAQHNESRYLFPRLIFINLAHLTQWDIRYETLISYLLAGVISFNVYYLNKLTINGNLAKKTIIFFLANLLIFAPIQYENWLWGIQLIVFMPIACITTCLAIAYSELNLPTKFVLCTVLSTVSTFSYANGILCWIIVFPVLALSNSWKYRDLFQQKWLILGWMAGLTTNAVIYFYDYEKPGGHPNFLAAIFQPIQAINYFLCFLGLPLGFGVFKVNSNIAAAIIFNTFIGALLVTLLILSWIYLGKFNKDFRLFRQMSCWLTIASYTVMSAIVTTLGRVGFGVEQSLSLRYATFSIFLPIALIHLVAIVSDDVVKKGYFAKNTMIFPQAIALGLVTIFLGLHLTTSIEAIKQMSDWRTERLQGKACLLFINVVQEKECLIQKVHPRIGRIKRRVNALNKIGLLKPRLIESNRVQNIRGDDRIINDPYGYGSFDNLTKKANRVVASGWARLVDRAEPADVVVLTYEKASGENIIFALSYTRVERKDVASAMKNNAYSLSGWQKSFEVSELPKGLVKINAWAFDTDTRKAFKLNGSQILRNL